MAFRAIVKLIKRMQRTYKKTIKSVNFITGLAATVFLILIPILFKK